MDKRKNPQKNPKLSARRKAEYALSKAYGLIEKREFEQVEDVVRPAIARLKESGWYADLHAEMLSYLALSAVFRGLKLDALHLWLAAAELATEPRVKYQVEESLRMLVEDEPLTTFVSL